MTSATEVASGLASTPSSWTLLPAAPSSWRAATMLTVVNGHTVVHSESTNARMTTLPRNCRSDIRWPNWLSSVMPGAGCLPSELPVSRAGLVAAACPWLPPAAPEPAWRAAPAQPASSTSASSTGASATLADARGTLTGQLRPAGRPRRRMRPGPRSCGGRFPPAPSARGGSTRPARLVGDPPVQPVAELAGNGGAGGVGLVAMDLDPPHPREPERDRGQRLGRGRPEAAAGLALGDPVTDLQAAVTHPPGPPARP